MIKCSKNRLHQLIAGRHRHQIDALELSSLGKKSLGGGAQDVVAQRGHLTTLRNKIFTHMLYGEQTQG